MSEVEISGASPEFNGVHEVVPVEAEFKTTLTPEQLEAALGAVEGRSFSGRNPDLGKMVNCQVCNLRHRANERLCEQKFTNRAGDFEYFHEETNKEGEVKLVPTLRTAMPHDEKPTKRQILGAAAFAKKRLHPHHSRIKLILIERVRVVFKELGFELIDGTSEDFRALNAEQQKAKADQFSKDLHRARVVAARQIRKERRFSSRAVRHAQDISRRINLGLLNH